MAVCIPCNNNYVPYAIVALEAFCKYNKNYHKYIIGTKFTPANHALSKRYGVTLLEVDLSADFINLDKRPYGQKYPIECFHHLYAYKLLKKYPYIVTIEPDVYTNRPLTVDLKSVQYIGGTHGERIVGRFLSRDLGRLKAFKKPMTTNQQAIRGGFRIYNTAGLEKIKFYETIVQYYKQSWQIGAPRCGDDSLMILYQMFHPGHVKLLDPLVHYISVNRQIPNYTSIILCHCIDAKWWKSERSGHVITNHFNRKFVEFLYNHFDSAFIKKYCKEIWVDTSAQKTNFYYWSENNNFGDLITPYFLKRFCRGEYTFVTEKQAGPKVISCGSIMRLCGPKTVVYGSGIRDIHQAIKPGVIQIVRGPLTRKRVLEVGGDCPPVYGDPGLLLPLYYKPKVQKKYKLGIIPHFTHYNVIKRLYEKEPGVLVVNLLNENIERVIDAIVSCRKVVSSSLHGLIVSDAYGIPNRWIKYDNKIKGDDTKYYDYFQSVGRKQTPIDALGYKRIGIPELIRQIGPVTITFDTERLKDEMFFDENGMKPYTKYLIATLR